MNNTNERYLLGPGLLAALCSKAPCPAALDWAERIDVHSCGISTLVGSMIQSVIDREATDSLAAEQWGRALEALLANMRLEGLSVLDIDAAVATKWRHWRLLDGLACGQDDKVEIVDQDIRIMLATADALGLTYVDFRAPYLEVASDRGLKVCMIESIPVA